MIPSQPRHEGVLPAPRSDQDLALNSFEKKLAIVQSNYIPWKGYFDLIAAVDEFVLYDDVQYTRRDWRNRNRIKTPQGVEWLTIPVSVKGRYHQSVRETEIDACAWSSTHYKALEQNYRRAPHFDAISEWLQPLYLNHSFTHLSDVNRCFIEAICNYLGIKTTIKSSSEYNLIDGKTERLASVCAQAGATSYISGPSARDYLDEEVFLSQGIKVLWFDYNGYSIHPQLWGEFRHDVTVLDLLFNCGPDAVHYLRYPSPRDKTIHVAASSK
jgi:hypothetical protein